MTFKFPTGLLLHVSFAIYTPHHTIFTLIYLEDTIKLGNETKVSDYEVKETKCKEIIHIQFLQT
jgi:hypothetical protein